MLAVYHALPPREFVFVTSPRGKPELRGPPGIKPMRFSVSRSGALALFAFTTTAAVGVDLEQVLPLPERDEIAATFFSARESATLSSLSEAQRLTAFFRAWTCKEAYLKATGEGISEKLPRIEVSLRPEEPPRLLGIDGNTESAEVWSLATLTPADQWMGALAVQSTSLSLECWSWPPS